MTSLVCMEPGNLTYSIQRAPMITPGRAIVKIRRVGICGTDLHAFQGDQPFFTYPRILGHELAGDLIEADIAPGFTPGEAVTIIPYFHCGTCIACRSGKPNCCVNLQVFGVHIDGGMSEYVSVPSDSLVHSNGLDYDRLALVEPLAIGAHGIRLSGLKKDEFVLVTGAGPIGLGAMEFARIAGARVIALDVNDQRLEFCHEQLGIPYTINALSGDILKQLHSITHGEMPTLVIDATGNLRAINQAFHYMAHGGRYVLIGLQRENISFSHPEFHKRESMLMSSRNANRQDFEEVMHAMEIGVVDPSNYITHRARFDDVKEKFKSWLDPANRVIKAMVELD
jgi:2-desacetyl-2-hydroxyethyl bacteriochlorophyllide A dehydrogenase